MRRPMIGVVGDARMPRGGRKWNMVSSLGTELIDGRYRIVTGGLGDLPKAIAEGARKSPRYHEGDLVAILPSFDPELASETADVVIATGLDQARNMLVANSDAVIAIGGGAGTLSELAYAWALKRLILAYRVRGWSGKLAGTRIDSRSRYAGLPKDQVYSIDNASDAVKRLAELLPKYNRRHSRIVVHKEGQ
ncbi:MAG: LOG family protein [Nitrososphaerales archaeon]